MLAPVAQVVLTWVDGTGTSTTTRHWIGSGTGAAAAIAAAESLAAAAAGLSGCALARVSVTYSSGNIATEPRGDGSGEAGVFVFDTATAGQYAVVTVPAIPAALHPGLPAGDGVTIAPAAPTVLALVEELVAGPWCNPFGHQLVELAAAYVQERR